jgi:hypothetical protein
MTWSRQTCAEKFWLENLGDIFSFQIVPIDTMSLAEQLNAITRLIIIIFIILFLLEFRYNAQFFLISILLIIFVFYIQKKTIQQTRSMQSIQKCQKIREQFSSPRVEYFTPLKDGKTWLYSGPSSNVSVYNQGKQIDSSPWVCQQDAKILVDTGKPRPFCNDAVSIDPPSSFAVHLNQNLVGQANPKTFYNPVVKPLSHDLTYWRDNNLITHSAINAESPQQDMYMSGYAESTCCGYLGQEASLNPDQKNKAQLVENFRQQIVSPFPSEDVVRENFHSNCDQIISPKPTEDKLIFSSEENFEQRKPRPNLPGEVNTICGYNPSQAEVELPTNLAAGNCEQDPVFKQYNKNLFTQIITPGMFSKNEVIEPINSNIGISFQQQFEPITCNRDEKGIQYTQHDPRIFEPVLLQSENDNSATNDNVYDPRFYGYGTSYRSYIDSVTGQPRFFYDDVNAVRMPNYLTRSKIDFLPFADSYGSVQDKSEFGNIHNPHIRPLVQDSWLRDSLQFREDLSERRMRKINSEAWQKRKYPNGNRPVGTTKR